MRNPELFRRGTWRRAAQALVTLASLGASLTVAALVAADDPDLARQWHLAPATSHGINAKWAWALATGRGVKVGVVDTGSRPHPDLVANLLPGYDFLAREAALPDGGNTVGNGDGDGPDPDATDTGTGTRYAECRTQPASPRRDTPSVWHGLHVMGLIAAVYGNGLDGAGIAPNAKIVPARVGSKCAHGGAALTAQGLLYMANIAGGGVPVNPNPVRVVNVSRGFHNDNDFPNTVTRCAGPVRDALDRMRDSNLLVVASAGNDGVNGPDGDVRIVPAGCPGVLTVASLDRDGLLATDSNSGVKVDIAAPGGKPGDDDQGLLSLTNTGAYAPGDDRGMRWLEGTSMAAPLVTGVAALMLELDPGLTADELAYGLKRTARPFPSPCRGCGAGSLDARAAADFARGRFIELASPKFITDGASGSVRTYSFMVPEGASELEFSLGSAAIGTRGNPDLYVQLERDATTSDYLCRSTGAGVSERCAVSARAGLYSVMVHGASAYANVYVSARYRGGKNLMYWNSKPTPLPDQATVEVPLRVERRGPAQRVQIGVDIEHTFQGDLRVEARHPDGTTYLLHDGTGGATQNLRKIYDVALNGKDANGSWSLKVVDQRRGDFGTVRNFSVTVLD